MHTGVREASLKCIAEVFKVVGEDVHKLYQTSRKKLDQKNLVTKHPSRNMLMQIGTLIFGEQN
jgi:hypothetical protein